MGVSPELLQVFTSQLSQMLPCSQHVVFRLGLKFNDTPFCWPQILKTFSREVGTLPGKNMGIKLARKKILFS